MEEFLEEDWNGDNTMEVYKNRKQFKKKIVDLSTTDKLHIQSFGLPGYRRMIFLTNVDIINYELTDLKESCVVEHIKTNKDLAEMNLVNLIKEF
jgi:hypothetical protein